MKQGCKVPGCERDYSCKGYCNLHYLRWRKYGDPDVAVRVRNPHPPEVCTVPDCHGKHVAKGFCWRHYKQLERHGEVNEEKGNDGRRNRPIIHSGVVSWPTANRRRMLRMNDGNNVRKFRINIADLPRKFLEGDRVRFSDNGVETTGTIVKIRSVNKDDNGNISYLCRVRCANGKEVYANLSSSALIK